MMIRMTTLTPRVCLKGSSNSSRYTRCLACAATIKTARPQRVCSIAENTARPASQQQSGSLQRSADSSSHHLPAATTAVTLVPLLLWADSAVAATVCIDVPDWLADWRGTLFHSPVLAVGVAGLAVVLFPKLIRTAINYLAIPAILAMVAYAAVSFPEQTANTTYTVLEFIKEHPTASSIGIVVGAGALLGPDLLAGTAVAGVLALLAVKLGILQMPQMPSLPKLPGQALLSRQLDAAGQAVRARLEDLDDDKDDDDRGDAAARRKTYKVSTSSSSSSSGTPAASMQVPAQAAQAQAVPPVAGLAARQLSIESGPPQWQQQQQQQQQQEGNAGPAGFAGIKGFTQQLGSAAKSLTVTAVEQGKAAGSAVLQQGKQLQESGRVQDISSQTAAAAGKAAQSAQQALAGLWDKGKQLQQGPAGALQALNLKQQDTTAAAAALRRAQDSPPTEAAGGGLVGAQRESVAAVKQQIGAGSEYISTPAAVLEQALREDVDSILTNS